LILTIVVATSLTNDTIATSLPETHAIHSRFIIGGDLSFHLESDEYAEWNNFIESVRNQAGVSNASLVSVGKMSLSEGTSGVVEFIAISPEEYSQVGYSYAGVELSRSAQAQLLHELESNPEGAILTSDVASEYNLIPGDTLRVFSFGDDSGTAEFNILGLTNAIPRPSISGQPSTDSVVGTRKIWLNRHYVEDILSLNETSDTYLCVRTESNVNTTTVGLDVLADFDITILSFGEWSSSTSDVESYLSQADYRIDRSIDSMITISMILSIFIGILTYHIGQRTKGSSELALLKSMGMSDAQITCIRSTEILGIIFLSLILVLIFGPLNVINQLRISFMEYQVWSYAFPISLFSLVNWLSFIMVLSSIIIPAILLILFLSRRSKIEDVAGNLRELFQDGNLSEGVN
jgi:ABC-type lipoprotein release transport system permease subunit